MILAEMTKLRNSPEPEITQKIYTINMPPRPFTDKPENAFKLIAHS
jgi:hypothetical protein